MSHIKNFATKALLYSVSFISLLISSWFFFGTNQEEDIIQTQSQFNLFFQTNPPTVFSETRTAGFGVSGLGSEVLWNAVGGVSSTVLDTLDMAELDSIATSNDFRLLHQMSNSDPITDTLKLSRFGFTIPPGANILGITLTLEKVQGNSNGNLIDTIITLTNPNLGIPANKKSAGLWPQLPSADALIAYGGASDLWNATWTPSEINADAFGALIRVRKTEAISTPSATTARLDLVSITVSYNFPCVDVFTETKGAGAGVSGPGNINTYWRDSAAVMGEPTPPALVTLLAKGLDSLNTSNNMRLFSQLNVNNLITDSLTLNQFGFNIPSGATILGIKLTIEKMQGNNNGNLLDTVITILNPASGIPVNKKSALTWPRTDTVFNYGGANDLWGPATWTPASINSNSFGALIRVRKSGAGATTARIDSISISVTYKFQERISKVFVDSSVAVTGDGLSWGTAFKTLQEGLNACFVDTICVAQGTYYPVSAGAGVPRRDISFCIPDSVKLFGGYPSGGMGERNWACNKTILCGDIDLNGDTLNNSYHVVYTKNVDSATIIDGFFIRGGNANGLPNTSGGGWLNDGSGMGGDSRPTIINCVFSGNTARNGGAMVNFGNNGGNASPHLINCLITGNSASSVGGGLVNSGTQGICLPVMTNCVISGNSSTLGGGALNVGNVGGGGACILTVYNSIVWNNISTSDANATNTFGNVFPGASTSVYYSILQAGGFTTGTLGMGINGNKPAGTDPLFVFAPLAGLSTAGDFHVKAGSMAIDMGNDAYNSYPFDLDSRPRIVNTIDIGAYESGSTECSIYLGITRIYVDSSATGGNNGFDWDSAFTNLQDALELARLCSVDTILVARGTYYPSDTIKYYDACEALSFTALPDREVSFNIPDSAVVLGGYLPGGSVDRAPTCNKTILCGDIQQDGIQENNVYHVVTTFGVSDATVVDGFCITGGYADGTFPDNVGGGWYNSGSGEGNESNPTIVNCIITGNEAFAGGGMYNNGSDIGNSSPIIINCIINNNIATNGGGVFNNGGLGNSSPQFTNCIISGNLASAGGGLFNSGVQGTSNPVLINCILSGNNGTFNGGGMINSDANPTMVNSITWNNSTAFEGTGTITISYSISQAGAMYNDGLNNKPDGTDPLFVNSPLAGAAPTAIGNFHVKSLSPARDMGDNAAITAALIGYPFVDLDDSMRIQNATVDLGAYELQDPNCADYVGIDVLYVDSTATGNNDGLSWATAFHKLQDALIVAQVCSGVDTIKVAEGTYFPSCPDTLYDPCTTGKISEIIPITRSDYFAIPDSTTVLGGYPSGGEMNGPRDPHCHITILSGDINRDGDSTGNTYNVVKTIEYKDTIVFDGFVIEQGNAVPICEEGGGWWDGSSTDEAKLIIRNSIFRNNYAITGGGFYGQGIRDLCISHSEFYQNEAVESPCVFGAGGGGAYVGCVMVTPGDTAFIRFENVLWHDNKAEYGGGLAGLTAQVATDYIDIVNNTFTLNYPDAIYSGSLSPINILNTIIWNNTGALAGTNPNFSVFNSIVQGIIETNGNKDQNPLFINPASNFRLTAASPAIDMGENTFVKDSTDLDNLRRIIHATVDMGAYEYALFCSQDIDTLYVMADGTVPSLSIDSLIDTSTLGPNCQLLVNNLVNPTEIPFDCSNLGLNTLKISLVKLICDMPDTLYMCDKIVVVIDTFPKSLISQNNINVSLDQNCMIMLTPKDVLVNLKGCENFFDIEISYPAGTNTYPEGDKLDRSHLGYCMVFSVIEVSTGNRSWGKLCVEDKAPPMITCSDDTVTCFDIAHLPQDGYVVNDNCGNPVKVKVAEESFEDYGCNGDPLLLGVVTRRLIATDQWGNSIDCTRKLYIAKTSLDSVLCPRDTSVDCSIAFIPVTLKDKSIILVPITDPSRSHAPQVKTMDGLVDIWPNNPSCKLTVHYTDEKVIICGGGYKVRRDWLITDWCTGIEKHCYQWIVVEDKTAPIARDTTLPVVYSDPHDCGRYVDIDTLPVMDCSRVKQNYSIRYSDEGGNRIIEGVLPVKHIWLPTGVDTIRVFLVDACFNTSKAFIRIPIVDNTPPTPVCDEFTQVTVDPEGCWSAVAAKDLDNGSRDNCCSVLHFAAAKMDSITYWRNYWNTKLEAAAGRTDFWKYKSEYDEIIEDWINCYVFSDTVHFDECGSNQVVLRVYEACGVPRYDPHVFPCSEHAWFCYNTYNYIGDFNYNWFDAKGAKACSYRPALSTIAKMDSIYTSNFNNGYFEPKYPGAAQYEFCKVPFYFPHLITACDFIGNISKNGSGGYCSERLYADCMVNVLVDDKQAPEIKGLEDITIYCDGAPGWADHPRACDNGYKDGQWPGYIVDGAGSKLDANGYIYGFYGGSEFLGIHPNSNDHDDPQACASAQGWAPIYCRQWLLIDSFDKAGHVNAADYFFTYKFKDKKLNQVAGKNQFTIFDNCHLDTTTLVVTNSGTINGCGEGWISRTWSIKDKCGNPVSATQKIYVKHRSDFEVLFPEDKIVTCDFLNRTDTSRMGAGSPIISDNECEQVGVRYEDEIFTVEDGVYSEPGLAACYKIVRTWTLIDWCIYDPNQHNHYPDVIVNDSLRANKTDRSCVYRNIKDNNDGYMQYVQIIKVIDEIPPVVTCEDYTICIDKDCSVLVNIPLIGTDNCADQVVFRIDITKPDNTHDIRSNVTSIAGTFTEGVYKVLIIGKDRCGNEDTCHMNLTIKDCKKPTPYCLDALATVIMPSTGTVEIWAKDFNRASTDNCTAEADLKYSFTSDVTKASQVITCADMTVDGRIQLITLDVYVTDKAGNQDLCRISIQVQDNGSASQPQGACRDTSASLGNLTGILKTEELEGVEKATIQIIPMAIGTNAIPAFKSGIDGRYQFGSIAINDSYTIKAIRDDEPMNGVSTLDLVNIQKHILGIERLKSPYKMIAADVNNDNDISAIDLLELRKLILGIYDKLPNNTSWKFVPKSYIFSDINNPWLYPTEESLAHMESNMVKDFVGIKIGDVNASAFPHSLMGTEIRNTETGLIFEVEDQFFHAGEQVKVEFRSPNFAGISGFQGTINFTNDHLRFDNLSAVPSIEKSPIEKSSIVNNKINITDKNIGKRWANEGQITMSWNSDKSVDVDAKSVLFTMTFTATKAGSLSEVLRIGSQHTIAESYEGKGELGNLSIRFVKNGKEIAGTNTLYQNYPNPFDQRTVIGINLAQSTTGQLKITDVTGRTIKSIDRDWNKGYNEVWLDRREIGATGVLYYSFESLGFNAVKKMVILE